MRWSGLCRCSCTVTVTRVNKGRVQHFGKAKRCPRYFSLYKPPLHAVRRIQYSRFIYYMLSAVFSTADSFNTADFR